MHVKPKGVTRALVLKANEAMVRSSSQAGAPAKKSNAINCRTRLTSHEINSAYAAAVKELSAA